MKQQNQRSTYSAMIEEVSPLLMLMAPIKQRAVLEVLVRKSLGVSIDFTDRNHINEGAVDVKVLFHFDIGLPVEMQFITDTPSMNLLRRLLFSIVVSHSYTELNDGTKMPVGALLSDHQANSDYLALFEMFGGQPSGQDIMDLSFYGANCHLNDLLITPTVEPSMRFTIVCYLLEGELIND